MVFSSINFLFVFLPVTLLFYFLVPMKWKNAVLLFFSLIFYAWGEPVYLLLMVYSIFMNYVSGLLMEKVPEHKKQILVFAILLNLFVIGFFKYYGFLLGAVNSLFGLSIPIRELALPIGISFYTFQALSYDIDLYRGKFPAQKNFISFATYITMFPQLIAGPIVRYEEVTEQLKNREISLSRFGKGSVRFIIGLAKKVLIANVLGGLFEGLNQAPVLSTVSAWLLAISYAFQIYFDFSGYSDMAIGLGEMLGFTFAENFNDPYMADSVTDFWRRWHISLSTWFKEYVYIPLGGNRVKTVRHILNLLIVWGLTGLWHGADWNFLLWGLYYGFLLVFEKYVWSKVKCPKVLRHILTLILVLIGWIIFSANGISAIGSRIGAMFGFTDAGLVGIDTLPNLLSYGSFLLIAAFFSTSLPKKIRKNTEGAAWLHRLAYLALIALLVISIIFMVTENYNPFLYFRF